MKRSARMAAFLLAAALSAAPCMAEFTPVEVPQATNAPAAPEATENVPQITEKGLTLGNNSVKYPEITGMADENIQQQVNDAILQAGKIENRLSRMAVLMSSPVPLTVTYSAALADDVLSVAILSSGALETERATQEWAAVNIDLRTGQEITFDDLFTDADEARAKMEETIADEILPDMSAHLAAAELLPLPPRPKRRMEVYGDSVSAGEVSEAEFACGQVDPEGHNGRYSNGYLSYSWQTARLLGAELHDIATGAWRWRMETAISIHLITSGCFRRGTKLTTIRRSAQKPTGISAATRRMSSLLRLGRTTRTRSISWRRTTTATPRSTGGAPTRGGFARFGRSIRTRKSS